MSRVPQHWLVLNVSSEDTVGIFGYKFMILVCASHDIFAGSEGYAEAKRRMLLLSRCVLMCVTWAKLSLSFSKDQKETQRCHNVSRTREEVTAVMCHGPGVNFMGSRRVFSIIEIIYRCRDVTEQEGIWFFYCNVCKIMIYIYIYINVPSG